MNTIHFCTVNWSKLIDALYEQKVELFMLKPVMYEVTTWLKMVQRNWFRNGARFVVQGEQKVSVHLMITIQKVTSNVQSVPRQSPDIYWHARGYTRLTLTASVIPNSNYVIMVSDWNCLKYFCVFFCTVIIRCTDTFWSPCIRNVLPHSMSERPTALCRCSIQQEQEL
jgi:hypothetical protein